MKGKCIYCGVQLKDIANIRCYKCDVTWSDGYKAGQDHLRSRLKEVGNAVKALFN